jgi:hypothetical protein
MTIRTDAALLVALLFIWCFATYRSTRIAGRVLLALVPSVAIIALANWTRYHSLFDHGYEGEGFTTPFWVGIYGILFSSGKSIFLFSPPLVVGCVMWRRFRERTRLDASFFLAVLVGQILLYCRWWDWSSDNAWGDRFLIPGVLLMCVPVIEACHRRGLLAIVGALGLAIQLLAVAVGGLDYFTLLHDEPATRKAVWARGQNQVDLDDIRFNPEYSQIRANWILVRHLLHIPPKSSGTDKTSRSPQLPPTYLYETLPPEAWVTAARWDFMWARRLHK